MTNLRPAIAIVLATSFGISAATPSVMPPSADAAVLSGYRLLYAGDPLGAQRTFEQFIASNPASLPAQFGVLHALAERLREDRSLQVQFESRIDAFIATAERRWHASSDDVEALFHLANAHLLRANYRVNFDKGTWGAARDGARAKRLSEQYIKRHPEHGDAYFALGTYNYYVEIAPAFLKVIRTFLFLPAGNRSEGMKQIERAYREGSLFGPQAGVLLMEIYSWYEGRHEEAIRIGERLASQYPDNTRIQFSLAEVYESGGLEDFQKAAERYQVVVRREEQRSGPRRDAYYRARLGLASSWFSLWRTEEALAALSPVIDDAPAQPLWVVPNYLLRRSNYRALLNDPRALEDANRVLAEPKWKDWHRAATERLQWIERRRSSGEAAVYAALIPGNRLAAERRWDDAAAAYARVDQQYPNHALVRHRRAVLRFRRGDGEGALTELMSLAQSDAAPWLKASAVLYVGRAHDVAGRRKEALKAYERVLDDYERESAAAAARVGLITPYRRPGR